MFYSLFVGDFFGGDVKIFLRFYLCVFRPYNVVLLENDNRIKDVRKQYKNKKS